MTEHEIRHGTRIAAERDALADTFPASDAPFWTLGERAAEFTLNSLILERDRIALLIRRDGLSAIVKWCAARCTFIGAPCWTKVASHARHSTVGNTLFRIATSNAGWKQ